MDGKINIDDLITHKLQAGRHQRGLRADEARRVDPLGGDVLMAAGWEPSVEHACFGGVQRFYRHASVEIGLPMRFALYLPPQALRGRKVPLLVYLAGLTCTEETFTMKAGAQRVAAELGLALLMPDTSPRGAGVPGEADSWDFGVGAGFYLDATQAPWARRTGAWKAGCWRAAAAGVAAIRRCCSRAPASSATRWAGMAR
jgi:hypothetical protein